MRYVRLNANGRDLPADMLIDGMRDTPDRWLGPRVKEDGTLQFQQTFLSPGGHFPMRDDLSPHDPAFVGYQQSNSHFMYLTRCKITLYVAKNTGLPIVDSWSVHDRIRAARALLGWSQQELADRAIVSLNALARLENGKVNSRISTLQAIEAALAKAGVEFLSAGQKGEGVRLLDPQA